MLKRLCCCLLGVLAMVGASAQPMYPQRPVTLVVPFAAGGDADQFARALARSLSKISPAPDIRLENQPGKSGTLASLTVRMAPADGYTLLVGRVGTHAIQPAVDHSTPYKVEDFTTLAILELDPLVCAVNASASYHTTRELLAAIRAKPGVLKYSTSGAGTILNFGVQYLMSTAGLPTGSASPQHFDGGLQAVAAVVDGKADFFCAPSSSAASAIRDGKLRGLFTTAAGRMDDFPQIPNAREAGFRAMSNVVGWTALMGPVGLPAEVTRYWHDALHKVAADAEWREANTKLGGQPAIRLITQPDRYVQEQLGLYRQLAASLKTQP